VIVDTVISDRVSGATSESVAGLDEPFSDAIRVAVWSETSSPVVAMNVAEVALAGMLTEEGMLSVEGALLGSVTTVVLAVDFDRVTVQAVLAWEDRLAASH
jgi:hypothetical protein